MHRDAPRREQGVGLIEVLIAMVIFSIGLLALAALYVRAAPQPMQDADAAAIQMAASGAFAALSADPTALPVNVAQATSASSLPTPGLAQWFASAENGLPGFTASIESGPDASGNACSAQSCGITLTLAWNQMGDTRSQEFYGQIGFH
ncbi:MAG: prepilin-type N-terminal cleavage/methylation domain-containing protein [Acidiferrobacterales bacterium]